ncbi:MAG: translation initiation factor IF-1 [Polyangiales bacterium]
MGREAEGVIEKALPQGLYRVKCDDGQTRTAALTGIPKQTIVRVVPGDRVILEVSDLDPTRGRIKSRLP